MYIQRNGRKIQSIFVCIYVVLDTLLFLVEIYPTVITMYNLDFYFSPYYTSIYENELHLVIHLTYWYPNIFKQNNNEIENIKLLNIEIILRDFYTNNITNQKRFFSNNSIQKHENCEIDRKRDSIKAFISFSLYIMM